MKSQQGFTLIELLVVIAIIGILSGIVLTSLNSARGKAASAKTISELVSAQAEAEIYYDDHNSYSGLCAYLGQKFKVGTSGANVGDWGCSEQNTSFMIVADASTPGHTNLFCVDSTGYKDSATNPDTANNRCKP